MGLFNSIAVGLGLKEQRTFGGIDVPTLEDIPAVINSIFGVTTELEEFERADGTKGTRLVTKGATPEQEEFISSLNEDITGLIGDIQELSSITAAIENEAFSPVINAVREQQADAREQAYRDRSRLEEEQLARRGLEDSTTGTEVREQRGAALQDQIVQDERQLTLLAEDLRNQALQRQAGALGTLQGERANLGNAGTLNANQFANLGSLQLGQAGLNLQSEQAVFNSRLAAQQNQFQNFGKTLSTLGTGYIMGGGFSPNGFSLDTFGQKFNSLLTPKQGA